MLGFGDGECIIIIVRVGEVEGIWLGSLKDLGPNYFRESSGVLGSELELVTLKNRTYLSRLFRPSIHNFPTRVA